MTLFEYRFFTNALLAALFASITCGITGAYIVSRRIVFISGGITHASFGGIGIGYFFGFNPIVGAMIFSVLSALGIEYMSKKTNLREDSVIAILWSFGMAVGIIFIFLTPGYSANLMSFLFGNILTVTKLNLVFLLILALLITGIFLVFFKTILFIAFDEQYARAVKLPVETINYLMITLIALTIVFNIKVVGIILVISLLTIPQTIANIFTKKFEIMIWLSIIIGFLGSISGLLLSYYLNVPSGAAIIFFLVILFFISKIFRNILTSLRIRKQIQ
ncbi:MAG TPA: metal ABC transporter permease [Bacteroidales bacterium]|nr:metal ABC transporter permease [Bacteroidales bacterium]MBP7874663.1 metal ABC transporter permease [Bacteroidales bacterium]MCZ2282838.1 metal ABC transporter permease [Bacteroidales bacterium]HNV50123.1 metal ABC transporter permease [Bacteroidales bacterium]HPW43339.1 metal ABC transporter permease [Bacteroidales bacterium]